mgnify:CR=1 FL=1
MRLPLLPFQIGGMAKRVAALRPDAAICAMPAPLDMLMGAALRRLRVPYAVVVHDADLHPGDSWAVQMRLQRRLASSPEAIHQSLKRRRNKLARRVEERRQTSPQATPVTRPGIRARAQGIAPLSAFGRSPAHQSSVSRDPLRRL